MAGTFSAGRTLAGRYLLHEEIATGGMGTVWRAEDELLSRAVAVKLVHPAHADDTARRRLHREALAAARLSHPNIVAVFDAGEDGADAYIVMELVVGPTLRRVIDDTGQMPVPTVVHVAIQIADALDAAHRNGVVHRDVKPGNVLVPHDAPVKVMDFGIAHAVGGQELTDAGTVMGTARYLAPEQLEGHEVDGHADVYSLGLVLFEMLTGHPPFRGDTDMASALARLSRAAPAVRLDRPEVPAALDDLVHRCLARAPHARPDAHALRDELLRIAGHTPGSGPLPWRSASAVPAEPPETHVVERPTSAWITPEPAPASRAPRRRRRRLLMGLGALVVLAAIVAAVSVLGDGRPTSTQADSSTPPDAVTIASASDFDPLGDGREDPVHVAAAIDGNPSTTWSTEIYQSFARDKAGVGLVVDLSRAARLRTLTVTTLDAGWDASVYVAGAPAAALDGWGKPVASGTGLPTQQRFTLDTRGRSVLLWFTRLPGGTGNERLRVAEVQVS